MFKTRPCGCKGLRSCKVCEEQYGAWRIQENFPTQHDKENSWVFCPFCQKLLKGWEMNCYKLHPNHAEESMKYSGIEVFLDFISEEEETYLLKCIDEVPWDLSQSGRYKQNYGPKCNFRKRKVCVDGFNGYPEFSKFIQDRFTTLKLLQNFKAVEQCSLDYTTERGASIDPHIDDCWIWGERIPTLSLLSDSVLNLTKYEGPTSRYNLQDCSLYPRIVNEDGSLKEEYELLNSNGTIKNTRNQSENENEDYVGEDQIDPALPIVIRVPMPRRSLMVLYGAPRYEWEHSIIREDINNRRVCITYRELTPPFMESGEKAEIGRQILERGKVFWNHKKEYIRDDLL